MEPGATESWRGDVDRPVMDSPRRWRRGERATSEPMLLGITRRAHHAELITRRASETTRVLTDARSAARAKLRG